ncbi:hypothetical protein OH76DRAFT_1421484 [Lentinus brumalis]|uniref:Fungal-type protein kinase domain-containing protein n=1 Tax=Lentinus brumalis TaxID=2498619 RepID=A0A371CVJ7_9APHY|nr:hypothetical protein OH76DRAFT_1421484 [Polyporus brumalis]
MPCNTGPPTCGPSPTSGEPPLPSNQSLGDARTDLHCTESANTLPAVASPPRPQSGNFAETGSAKREQRRLELDRETKWCELPVARWMHRYTSGGDSPVGVISKPFMIDLEHQEQGMYDGLTTGLNNMLTAVGWTESEALSTDRLPDVLTTGPNDEAGRNFLRPDLGIYPRTQPARISSPDVHTDARVAWFSVEVVMEVKWETRAFPFASRHTPRSPFLPSGRERCLSRGQLVEYATEVFNRQHRQSVFVVVFVQDCARFLRFDRSGAVVSEEFDYLAHPEIIASFLYRLSKMSPAQRGYDPSATRASADEEAIFKSLAAKYPEGSATQHGLCKAASEAWPVYKLTFDAPFSPDGKALTRGTPQSRRQILVGRPSSVSTSLTGRGTRTFVAYDLTGDRVVFIKDTWRVVCPGTRSELETYLHLRENATGELYVPTLLGGGDVLLEGEPQRTDACEEEARVHARLVFKEICRPIEDFTNAFELVKCVTWALVAHAKAWRECDLLHRAISTDSILIYDASETGQPDPVTTIELLGHWDLAAHAVVHDPGGGEHRDIGSWPFVSARLQELPEAPHGLADDLESFMHVLNLCALKHLPHALSDDAHQDQLAHVLQSLYELPGKIASPLRLEKVQNGMPFVKGLPDGHPMDSLLAELSRMCKLHYEHVYSPPPTSACAPCSLDGGVVCGLASGVPDFDIGPTTEEGKDAQFNMDNEPPMPVPDPALSPLRDHSRMVSACMRAIRKVWPRVDRVQREKARGHRAARKRTRTDSGSVIRQESRVYKKARKSTTALCVNASRGAHVQVVET